MSKIGEILGDCEHEEVIDALQRECDQLRESVRIHNIRHKFNATDACSGKDTCWCINHELARRADRILLLENTLHDVKSILERRLKNHRLEPAERFLELLAAINEALTYPTRH